MLPGAGVAAYGGKEPLEAPALTPAYRGGDRQVAPADTEGTPEAPISEEIARLAMSLQWNPVLIYEWVKNTIETEWYCGKSGTSYSPPCQVEFEIRIMRVITG